MAQMPQELRASLTSRPSASESSQNRVDGLNLIPGKLKYMDCPACLNRGFIWYSKKEGLGYCEYAYECACVKRRRSLKKIIDSGLYELLEECNFESFKTCEPWQEYAKGKAQEYLEDYKHKWFCALGSVGAGKTHLCTAICGQLLDRGLSVQYMLWLRDSPPLKGIPESMEARTKALDRLANVDVLYIDDFFKNENRGRPTAADIKLAHEIINSRYIKRATTLISSEWSINEILGFDEAIGSRIYQRGKEYILSFTGEKNQRLLC